MQKWQNILILGLKRSFVQTRALYWKSLKNGALSAKMRKRADLGLKTLFCKNSGNLLKIANKWFVNRKKMTKRADVGLKTLFCTNSCTLLKLAKRWCTQWEVTKRADVGLKTVFAQICELCWKWLKSRAPSAEMTKRADLGLKTLFCANSWSLLKIANEPANEWVAN